MLHKVLNHGLLVLPSSRRAVEAQMQVDEKLLREVLRFLVLREERHLPQGVHAKQLIKAQHLKFGALSFCLQVVFGLVDGIEVLLEHFDKGDRD